MNRHRIWQLAKSDYLKLLPILGLAFYLAFIPKLNYPYPVHIDEWIHLAYSKAMLSAGSTTFVDLFSGQSTLSLSSNLETGFHLFLVIFQRISGISWIDIFRYLPGIIFMMVVLLVFVMARRKGFGWEAALIACLIPATVGVLGPAFLVPVAMGLLFTPLILFLAFNLKTVWSYLLIFILTCFLLAMHAPSAICPIIILIPYILFNLKDNFKHSLGIALALALPFLVIFPWIFDMLLPTAKNVLIMRYPSEYVQLPRVLETLGYFPIGLSLLGIFVLAMRGGKEGYGLIFGLLAVSLMLVTFYTFHYGLQIMYTRGLMFMMLMISIVAGAGLMGVKNLKLPESLGTWLRVPFITRNVGKFLCLAIIVGMLYTSIPDRLDTPYYHMIDDVDYEAFVWIKDNVDASYTKAIVDPWKATAFSAITERSVYTRIHVRPYATDKEAYAFIRGGSTDTAFLRGNGISIIYTRVYSGAKNIDYESDNPDIEKLAHNIYLLKESQ